MQSIGIALAVALLPAAAQVFPPPLGDYQVHLTHTELVDHGRLDPFNETHVRRIMVSQFTPIPHDRCTRTCRTPYMSTEMSHFQDDILLDFFGDIEWPGQILDGLELETCCEVKDDHRKTACFPTVLLDTGLNMTRLLYTGTAQQIASLGYRVVVMDHPYETDVVRFPDGSIIFGGQVRRDSNETHVQLGLDVRVRDASLVLDALDIHRAVYVGHSYGGGAAATALLTERRLAGGVNLDGLLWGRVLDTGVPLPFVHFVSEATVQIPGTSLSGFWDTMDEDHPDVWYLELGVNGTVHNSFTDFPIIGDVTGLRDVPSLKSSLFGEVTGERMMALLKGYLGDFVRFTLLDEDAGLLAEQSPTFPEVEFLREGLGNDA